MAKPSRAADRAPLRDTARRTPAARADSYGVSCAAASSRRVSLAPTAKLSACTVCGTMELSAAPRPPTDRAEHGKANKYTGEKDITMARKNATATTTRPVTTEGGKRSHFDEVLDKVKYVGVGNGLDGSAYTIEDGEVGLGLNALEWLCYEVAKVFVVNRDYLPTHWQDAVRRISRVKLGTDTKPVMTPFITSGDAAIDDLREDVKLSIFASLEAGQRETAIRNAFQALDKSVVHDKYDARDRKTLPKEEVLCDEDIGLIRSLIEGTTSYEVRFKQDDRPDLVARYEVSPALLALFDEVKTAHKFAFTDSMCTRWRAFEYFVLNVTNAEIASRLAISKQRASALNCETCKWFLDAVKNLDLEHLEEIAKCPKTLEKLRQIQAAALAA